MLLKTPPNGFRQTDRDYLNNAECDNMIGLPPKFRPISLACNVIQVSHWLQISRVVCLFLIVKILIKLVLRSTENENKTFWFYQIVFRQSKGIRILI